MYSVQTKEFTLRHYTDMMTRLSEAVQSYRVKSKGVKKLLKRLEEPGFPARLF